MAAVMQYEMRTSINMNNLYTNTNILIHEPVRITPSSNRARQRTRTRGYWLHK